LLSTLDIAGQILLRHGSLDRALGEKLKGQLRNISARKKQQVDCFSVQEAYYFCIKALCQRGSARSSKKVGESVCELFLLVNCPCKTFLYRPDSGKRHQ
jgi:hypothetical protein